MRPDPVYEEAADSIAGRIRSMVPMDLAEQFGKVSRLTRDDFHSCTPVSCGDICAVDGSNAILLESGSMAITLIRAAQSTFTDMKRAGRAVTSLRLAQIGPSEENGDFTAIYEDCFGQKPGTPLMNEDRVRTSGILRDTIEYWVLEMMASSLKTGALLLRDGPLRVSHASHDPVLSRIIGTCSARGIDLAGVSKKTSATWGGGHPLLPSVGVLAEELGLAAPWWVRIDPAILDHTQFARWQHGRMYVGSLHPGARSPLKIELPSGLSDIREGRIMNRLAACSGDGRVPGYPYPLFDAHRTVVLTEEIAEHVRSDMMRRIAGAGIGRQTFEIMFGDYHDEFARY